LVVLSVVHQSAEKMKTPAGLTKDALVMLSESLSEPYPFRVGPGFGLVYSSCDPTRGCANEDAAAIIPVHEKAAVFVVADGCGGMADGAGAARRAIREVTKSIRSRSAYTRLGTAVLDGIERADRRISLQMASAGTTIAAVEVAGPIIRTYHVGDSQVLLVGNRGQIRLRTRAHAPVAYAVQAGVLSEEDALSHQDRHLVSNILGTNEAHIEIGPRLTMRARDTMVVATDGLFANLRIGEIASIVRRNSLEMAAWALVDAIARRMSGSDADSPCQPDDVTFILYRAGEPQR
jgi:serine/threonine protein phosphatase PrpC